MRVKESHGNRQESAAFFRIQAESAPSDPLGLGGNRKAFFIDPLRAMSLILEFNCSHLDMRSGFF